jgi:hypothetical protein
VCRPCDTPHTRKGGTNLLRQLILKLLVALALILTLLGGAALSRAATTAKVAPAHHLLACGNGGVGFPPCD